MLEVVCEETDRHFRCLSDEIHKYTPAAGVMDRRQSMGEMGNIVKTFPAVSGVQTFVSSFVAEPMFCVP